MRYRTVDATTLYLHGLGFGQFFWQFQQAQGYDYAANEARNGQVSVVIDRLGYGSSDKPYGYQIRADIALQMVADRRTGNYWPGTPTSARSPRWRRTRSTTSLG